MPRPEQKPPTEGKTFKRFLSSIQDKKFNHLSQLDEIKDAKIDFLFSEIDRLKSIINDLQNEISKK